MSIAKARKFGWNRYDDTEQTLYQTFRTFENAGILPAQRAVLSSGHQSMTSTSSKDILQGPTSNEGANSEPEKANFGDVLEKVDSVLVAESKVLYSSLPAEDVSISLSR